MIRRSFAVYLGNNRGYRHKLESDNPPARQMHSSIAADDQNSPPPPAALMKAEGQKVFTDEGLSRAMTKRPSLLRCIKTLPPGDTLIAMGAAELTESLGPPAIDDIPVGHYVPLLEFNHASECTVR
jgi:hypothetical protein